MLEEFINNNDWMKRSANRETTVLEIGCCSGYNLVYLYSKFGFRCYGIDPSKSAISYGNQLIGECEKISLTVGTSDILPSEDESIDIVLIGFCLFWVDRRYLMRTISEVDRVVKQGGIVVLEDFDTVNPYKRDNKHNRDAYTYKMDYSKLFLSNPQYQMIYMDSYSHESGKVHQDIQERVATKIIYKDYVDDVYIYVR